MPGPGLPSDQLDLLMSISRKGLAFIGDSPTGRMYVRTVAYLEGVREEWLAEALQNSLTMLSGHQLEELLRLNLTDLTSNSTRTQYTGAGKDSPGEYSVRLEDSGSGYNLEGEWMSNLATWNVSYLYVGLPFLHQLWQPGNEAPQQFCNASWSIETALESLMRRLQKLAIHSNTTILVGTANMCSASEGAATSALINSPDQVNPRARKDCAGCWAGAHRQRCHRYSYTMDGLKAINDLAVEMAEREFDRLHIVRMDKITGWIQDMTGASLYWGAGHYKGPVIDLKLSAMLCAVPEGRVLRSCIEGTPVTNRSQNSNATVDRNTSNIDII